MKFVATVLHNFGQGQFWPYDKGRAELFHAHNFVVEADSAERAADLVWILANVDGSDDLHLSRPSLSHYSGQVTAYRSRMNRSLSVGDVIVLSEGDRPAGALAVARLGFEACEVPEFTGPATNEEEHSAAYAAHLTVLRDQRTPAGRSLSL